jgi:hypothetical protein
MIEQTGNKAAETQFSAVVVFAVSRFNFGDRRSAPAANERVSKTKPTEKIQ